MRLATTAAIYAATTILAHAATVTLDRRAGGILHFPTTDVATISSNYAAWPENSLGLWVSPEYEVLLIGDTAYQPYGPPEFFGVGNIASNNPGYYQWSVQEVIRRTDGKPFSLTSLDTTVGFNQVFALYEYLNAAEGTYDPLYVELSSFEVTVATENGMTAIDPFSHQFSTTDSLWAPGISQTRIVKTDTDFANIADGVNYVAISSRYTKPNVCDAEPLSQAPLLVQAAIPCDDPASLGQTSLSGTAPDGGRVFASVDFDTMQQNYLWSFDYSPTLTSDSITPVPLPEPLAMGLLAVGGLFAVGRRRKVVLSG